MPYWVHSGNAISSRLAEECLGHIESLRELPSESPHAEVRQGAAHERLRERIAGLLERAPTGGLVSMILSLQSMTPLEASATSTSCEKQIL